MTCIRVACVATVLGCLLIASDALGQQQRTPYPPRPEATASKPAIEKVNKARADVSKAQSAAGAVAGKIRQEFESGADWQAASGTQKQAQAESEGARKRVLEAVHSSAAYKQGETAKKAAEGGLVTAKASGNLSEITPAATKVMECGSVLSKMDADGLAADAQFVESKKKLLDANAKVAALTKEGDEKVKADPAWQQARKDVEAAETVKAQADKELATAVAQDAQMIAQWRQQCAQIDQQNRDRAYQEAQMRRQQNQNNNNNNNNRRF